MNNENCNDDEWVLEMEVRVTCPRKVSADLTRIGCQPYCGQLETISSYVRRTLDITEWDASDDVRVAGQGRLASRDPEVRRITTFAFLVWSEQRGHNSETLLACPVGPEISSPFHYVVRKGPAYHCCPSYT